jgi:hypothetical protein
MCTTNIQCLLRARSGERAAAHACIMRLDLLNYLNKSGFIERTMLNH